MRRANWGQTAARVRRHGVWRIGELGVVVWLVQVRGEATFVLKLLRNADY